MSRWWRAYDEALDDAKLQILGLEMVGAWFNLLCLASKNGGNIKVADVPFALRLSKGKAAAIITRLAVAGLIDRVEDDYIPHNWSGRQYYKTDGIDPPGLAQKGAVYIYFVGSPGSTIVKIGISKNPWARLCELQTGHHEERKVLATFRTKSPSEADLHACLAPFRKMGEWFDLPSDILSTVISLSHDKISYEALVAKLRSSSLRSATSTTTEQTTEQKTESERKEDTADAAPYAFESGVIRLRQKDFDQWKRAFSHLDVPAELLALTEWAGAQGQKWFFAVSSALAKKNREIGVRIEQTKSAPAYRWNGMEGVT